MPKVVGTKTIRMAQDALEYWENTYVASGANSQGEFAVRLLDKYNTQEEPKAPEIKTVEVERQIQPDEIILPLSPAQMFALKNTVLSRPDFAEHQNKIIDDLKSGWKPFMYFGDLFEPEFQSLWIRSMPITKEMTDQEKETTIKYNMSAFLINMFLIHLIEGKIDVSKVNASNLKAFILKQESEAKAMESKEKDTEVKE